MLIVKRLDKRLIKVSTDRERDKGKRGYKALPGKGLLEFLVHSVLCSNTRHSTA